MNETNYINGEWLVGGGDQIESIAPATGNLIDTFCSASPVEVNNAVLAAHRSFTIWRKLPLSKRIGYIKAFQNQLQQESKSLSELISVETGKPVWEAIAEVSAMIAKVDISIEAFHQRTGTHQANSASVTHKPHGVVAVFGPYNFPGHLPNGHIVPALIAGNTVVLKPSELVPLVAAKIMSIWHGVNIPNGVINLVQGGAAVGNTLAQHPNLKGLFFTGSSTIGQHLHRLWAGQTGKILALEMGGNNPLVVTDVCDIQAAVYHIIQSAFVSSGQRCTCARRLFLPASTLGDEILSLLIEKTRQIKPDLPHSDPQPFISSLISHNAAQEMLSAQDTLNQLGATVLLNMKLVKENTGMLTPGIIDITDCYQAVPDEEHFGPLLKVIRYSQFEQAITMANDTRFGLSAGLLSDHLEEFSIFQENINAGIINWNSPTTGAKGNAPFGGIGDSGNHRPGAYYAADYCAYPVANVSADLLTLPSVLSPGLSFS